MAEIGRDCRLERAVARTWTAAEATPVRDTAVAEKAAFERPHQGPVLVGGPDAPTKTLQPRAPTKTLQPMDGSSNRWAFVHLFEHLPFYRYWQLDTVLVSDGSRVVSRLVKINVLVKQ